MRDDETADFCREDVPSFVYQAKKTTTPRRAKSSQPERREEKASEVVVVVVGLEFREEFGFETVMTYAILAETYARSKAHKHSPTKRPAPHHRGRENSSERA